MFELFFESFFKNWFKNQNYSFQRQENEQLNIAWVLKIKRPRLYKQEESVVALCALYPRPIRPYLGIVHRNEQLHCTCTTCTTTTSTARKKESILYSNFFVMTKHLGYILCLIMICQSSIFLANDRPFSCLRLLKLLSLACMKNVEKQ